MAKALTLGMLQLWEKTFDEAIAPAMNRIEMVRHRNKLLARHEIEQSLGYPRLKAELEKAKARVEQIEQMIADLGLGEEPRYGRHANTVAHRKVQQMIEEKAKEYDSREIAEFVVNVQTCRERVRLSMFPSEVRDILSEMKMQSSELLPALQLAEVKAARLLKAKKVKTNNSDDDE